MEKRTLIAIVLSMLILLVWSWMTPKPQPISKQRAVVVSQGELSMDTAPLVEPKASLGSSLSLPEQVSSEEISVNMNDVVQFNLALPQGYLNKVYIPAYNQELPLEDVLFLSPLDGELNFTKDPNDLGLDRTIIIHEDSQKKIIQSLSLTNSEYVWNWQITFINKSDHSLNEKYRVYLGKVGSGVSHMTSRFLETQIFFDSQIMRQSPFKPFISSGLGQFKAIGFRGQYLCAILVPFFDGASPFVSVQKRPKKTAFIGIDLPTIELGPKEQITKEFSLYLGPQDATYLSAMGKEYEQIIYFGKLDVIAKILARLLRFGFSMTKNWGLAIILLSVFIFLIFYPLSSKSMKSLKAMQTIQPEMAALREKHKSNPQKINKETLELYRKHKVNPLGGCLPFFFQIPVFFSLYTTLMRSIELKGAGFLWIKDLSAPDALFRFQGELPVLGQSFNLLPILMAIVMYFQQKMSQASATGPMAEQQKMMKIIFPIMFGFIFYKFPSGLVLYWFTNSLLTVLSQWKMQKAKQ